MSELKDIFLKLSELYKSNKLTWMDVSEIYEKEINAAKSNVETDENDTIYQLFFIKTALQNPDIHLSTMMELCTTIRSILCDESPSTCYGTQDSWEHISKAAEIDSYLAYIYALAALATLDPVSSSHTKLSMAAVSTYFLSLTIPSAKAFHVFDEEIIAHCLQIFALTERIQHPDVVRFMSKNQEIEIWVHLTTLCDDLKLLLRYVHFKDNTNVRDALLKKLINILHLNYERGYANLYAANLHKSCFEIFEELIYAHNGDPEESLNKLLNMTALLHTYPPKPKSFAGMNMSSNTSCEHISDWFINNIAKYPRLLVKVLSFYIECMITNPVKTWKTEQIQRALEYAAKYDAALFTKCNESSVNFLCDSILAEEVMIRSRSVELLTKILQIESKVDWQMFRDEVSNIPREVLIIKEIIDRLQDGNNTIKLRAVQALQTALTKGSPNAKKIMTEGIRFARYTACEVVLPIEPKVGKNEIRYTKPEAPKPEYTFEGHGLVELSFFNLPEYIFNNILRSSVSNLRRAGIAFLEQIIIVNPLIIFETKFISRMIFFTKEPTALVRKQAMQTLDSLLNQFPYYPIIWIWCKILSPMLSDADPKNIELAMNCFHSRVLLNLKPLEQSNKAEHFMPWVIIRTMLSTESRLYLQVCFNLVLKKTLIDSHMISTIESHLLTSNSMEAWIILNFISGKIKSKEPDALIHMFISQPSWNKEHIMFIAIEVLANCIDHFSHTALNHAFNHIISAIRTGEMLPVLIGKTFAFLKLIDQKSVTQSMNSSSSSASISNDWIKELHEHLEINILQEISEFPRNRATLVSHLYSYSEANVQTRQSVNSTVIEFLHKFISACLQISENDLDLENERLFNSMILISGRFSLRDPNVASATCELFEKILCVMDHPPIVNSIFVAVTDICKKHTHIVERIIGRMLSKLNSPFIINRTETFKCFQQLVLQDQLKLRDTLLLALLSVLLDDSEELVMLATNFFAEFTSKKNPTLFQKCLTEYPFVLNEYKNFSSKESFSKKMIDSPFKGNDQRKKRYSLYNYFMADMDEVHLILYFNQLKLLAEKCKTDPLMKTADGVTVLRDIFFILKRVCQLTKEKKSTTENKGEEKDNDDDAAELSELNEPTPAATATASTSENANVASNSGNVGRGRRRRHIVTLEDAHTALEKSLVFIPVILSHMEIVDPTIQKSVHELCILLAERFKSFVDEAHPSEFWKQYRTLNLKPHKSKPHKRKSNPNESSEESNDSDCSDVNGTVNILNPSTQSDAETESDDLPPIRRHNPPSPSKRMRSNNAETLMESVFKPNM